MGFSLDEYARKRSGTGDPSASLRLEAEAMGRAAGVEAAPRKAGGGFSLDEYHRQKTGGAKSQTLGNLPGQSQPREGVAETRKLYDSGPGLMRTGLEGKGKTVVKPWPTFATPWEEQKPYVEATAGMQPSGVVKGLAKDAQRELDAARAERDRAESALHKAESGSYLMGKDSPKSAAMPYAAGQQAGMGADPALEAVRAAREGVKTAKDKLDAMKGAHSGALDREREAALPTDLGELRQKIADTEAARDQARDKMDALNIELSAMQANPVDGQDYPGKMAEYKRWKAEYEAQEEELSYLSQHYSDRKNTQRFDTMRADWRQGMRYSDAKTLEDDLQKLTAVLDYDAGGSGADGTDIEGYRDALMKKYGLGRSAFTDYAGGAGGGPVAVLYETLNERIRGLDQESAEMGYDNQIMRRFEQQKKREEEDAQRAAQLAQFAEEHPVIASGLSVPIGLGDAAIGLLRDWGTGQREDPDHYLAPEKRHTFASVVRGTVSKKIERETDWNLWGRNVGSFLYQTGMSVADNAVLIATLGTGAGYVMGLNAAVSQAGDIVDRGGTREQAFWGGLAAGVAEMLFERVSIENLLTHKNVTDWKGAVWAVLKQSGVEASEEFCTEIANILSDTAIMGANSNYANAVRDYQAQGMTAEQARRQAYLDQIGQVVEAAAGGAISGGVMSGGQLALDYAGNSQQWKLNDLYDKAVKAYQKDMKDQARRAREAEVLRGIPLTKSLGEAGRTGLTNAIETRLAQGTFTEKLDPLTLAEGYQEVYLAGLSGVELEPGDVPTMAGPNAELLSPTERMQAYYNGVNDAKARVERNQRRAKFATVAGTEKGLVWDAEGWVEHHLGAEVADRMNETAKRLGVRVVFEDSLAGGLANGQIVEADIRIAKDADQPWMVVFGHEVGHWLEKTAPEAYRAMRRFTSQRRMTEVEARIQEYQRVGREQSFDDTLKEFVNDDIGRMIADPQILQSFIEANKNDRTLLQRLADAFRALWQKLTGKDRQQVKTAEEALLAALKASEAQAAKMERAGQVMDFDQGQQGGDGEYSIKQLAEKDDRTAQTEVTRQYQRTVDTVMDGSYGKSEAIIMGYTPEVYQQMGMPSLPFVIGPGHVYSIAKTADEAKAEGRYSGNTHFHGLGVETVKKLYDKATKPVMVIAAKDVAGNKRKSRSKHSVVAIVDVGTQGESLFLPIEITAERTVNGQQMDVNVLSSAYKRSVVELVREAIAQENAGQVGIYYATKEAKTLLVDGAQCPKRLTEAMASTGIVHSIPENVNMKIMDQTQSLQFKRWFGDWQNDPEHASKVVDAEGKPLVVYHGTLERGITAFNKDFIGSRYGADDVGFFFVDRLSMAEDYARSEFNADRHGEVIPAYLDIKKPLVIDAAYVRANGYGDIFKSEDAISAWDIYQGAFLDAAKEMGADGILVKDGTSTMAVVFEPTQIKSATENIGTFDRENPDIRYSLKSQSRGKVLEQESEEQQARYEFWKEQAKTLDQENEALKAKYDFWKKQTRRSDAGKVSEEAVGRYVRSTMQDFGIKGDAKAVSMKLLALYDGMASGTDADGGELVYRDFAQTAREIAGELVRNAVTVDSTLYDDYAELRAYIRRTTIVVDAETRASMADYEDFRKGSMGRLRLQHGETGNIDQVYTDLARMWPELFSEEVTAEQDQLERIAQVMGQIYAREEINPFGGDLAGATEAMAHEIMEQFWEIPGEKATYADRQWRIRQEMKRQHMAEIRTAIRAEREKGKVNERNLKEWYRDRDARNRAYKAESEARNRLLKLAARMKRMPTDGVTKALIRELVGELDTEARHLTGKKLAELTELRRFCEAKADPDSESYDPDFILDAGAASALKRLEMKHIDDLTIQEVQELTKVLLNLEHEIRTSKRLVGEQEDRDIYQLGERVIKDVRAVKGGDKAGVAAALDKYIVTETLSPLRQVRRMVGYREDSPLVKLTESLADGQRKMLDYQMRAEKPFERFANDKAFSKGFSGKDAKTVKILGMVQGRSTEVEVTRAMMVSLWLHSQNDQNALHMRDGGVRVPDMELYRKGKIQDAYAAGTVVKVSPSAAKGLWGQMTKTEREFARAAQDYFGKVSKPAINEVSNVLKGYDLAEVENYFPIQTDKTFGKADLETLKFDGTIEGMGFLKDRMSHAHSPMVLEDVNSVVERAIRMHGKYVGLAVPVRNFGKVWNVSTAARVEEAQKTISTGEEAHTQPKSVKWSSYGDSVQNAIQAVWGAAGYNYLVKMMTDLQGGGKDTAAWAKALRKVRSNYAGAVLTLNASVAMKQAASYPTAAAVLGWKPLAQAMKDFGKVDLDLIAKYTPLQAYRSKGFSTRELGDIQTQGGIMKEVLSHKALNWIQGVDLLTTRKLWKASEYYVRDNSPKLAVGSDAYYKAVAEVYNRVIEETQPNYTTMQRPQMLRSDNSLIGELMMFKTQPFQNFNILYDAAGEYRAVMARLKAGEATKAQAQTARQKLNRAVTSQVAQLGVFAAMTMLWGMFRGRKDKYDKDGDGEIDLFGALEGLGKDMVGGAATMVPWGSELWEFASSKLFGDRYYGIEPVGIGAITDTASSLSKMGSTLWGATQSAIRGEGVDWKGLLYQLDDCWDDVSKTVGLPHENVVNLFNAFARWGCIAAQGEYMGEYAAMHLTTNAETSQTVYMDLLYRAMDQAPREFEKLYAQMMRDGFDAKKVRSAMESRMKKAEGVEKVSELDQRFLTPREQREYDAAMKTVKQTDLWSEASRKQRDAVGDDLYEFLTRAGGTAREETWEAWETAGFDETTYALYQLAREMTDQPNKNGKLGGSPTNEEREDAIALIPGLTVAEKAALWELAGGKEKSNPWG